MYVCTYAMQNDILSFRNLRTSQQKKKRTLLLILTKSNKFCRHLVFFLNLLCSVLATTMFLKKDAFIVCFLFNWQKKINSKSSNKTIWETNDAKKKQKREEENHIGHRIGEKLHPYIGTYVHIYGM